MSLVSISYFSFFVNYKGDIIATVILFLHLRRLLQAWTVPQNDCTDRAEDVIKCFPPPSSPIPLVFSSTANILV